MVQNIRFSVYHQLKEKNTPYANLVAEAIKTRARKNFVFTEGKHFVLFIGAFVI